jgi:hypothetical protein
VDQINPDTEAGEAEQPENARHRQNDDLERDESAEQRQRVFNDLSPNGRGIRGGPPSRWHETRVSVAST